MACKYYSILSLLACVALVGASNACGPGGCQAPASAGDDASFLAFKSAQRVQGRTQSSEDAVAEQHIVDVLGSIDGFMWGTATAAYQIEGAVKEGGRQPSIWDYFSLMPKKTAGGSTGEVADDFYHRYEEDIQRVKDYGFNAFRYSMSWGRIYPRSPDGKHRVNMKGINFYKKVTAAVLDRGLTPMVTLYHWDLPRDLDWLDRSVVRAFVDYAAVVWAHFPEIQHWATFNEPWCTCELGYKFGSHAPGLATDYGSYNCTYHVLLAHASAVALWTSRGYRETRPEATVGIVLNYDTAWPLDPNNPKDAKAALCKFDFQLGRFTDPIYGNGDWPPCMKERLGKNLPSFTMQEQKLIKGSVIGPFLQNFYTASYAFWAEEKIEGFDTTQRDMHGDLIGKEADSAWLAVVPMALRDHLVDINNRYQPDSIIITENGVDVPGEDKMPLEWALNDTFRVDYYRSYLDQAAAAVQAGVPLKGYFAWSLLDNYEWADGYAKRFGLTYVNYTTQKRYPKASAKWFQKILQLPNQSSV